MKPGDKKNYEALFDKSKKVDPRVRGILGIYYQHGKRPTIKLKFPIYFVETLEIFTLYIKLKGHRSFNRWFKHFIETETKKLKESGDEHFKLASEMYKDIKNKNY